MMIYDAKKIHFVGIGGIGVSALAQWFLSRGCRVSGSNLSNEPILRILRRKGAKIYVGRHNKNHVRPDTNLLIYSAAVDHTNPERKMARRLGITEMSYPEAVGELTKNKFTIAICGTHGKSTTTAMAGLLLTRAGLDPTVFVGTKLKEFEGSNCRIGKSRYFVLEADEWAGAFWHYHPDIIIWTTADSDHLDFYKTFRGVLAGFRKFLKNLKPGGIIIANGDDLHIRHTISYSNVLKNIGIGRMRRFYSLQQREAKVLRRILQVPGKHNVSNALAVLLLAKALNIPRHIAYQTITKYRGAWRRFEYRGKLNGAKIFDDYAHHPTEINATLMAARTLLGNRGQLWCVFQPHQYQRLKLLFKEFTKAFDEADRIIILPVYIVAGRDRHGALPAASRKLASLLADRGADAEPAASRKLASFIADRGADAEFAPSFRSAAKTLKKELRSQDICVIMGAGDIVKIHKFLHNK